MVFWQMASMALPGTVESNGSEPPHDLLHWFYFHAPGLTLVTLELHAFHLYAFLPPLGKSRVLPKELG